MSLPPGSPYPARISHISLSQGALGDANACGRGPRLWAATTVELVQGGRGWGCEGVWCCRLFSQKDAKDGRIGGFGQPPYAELGYRRRRGGHVVGLRLAFGASANSDNEYAGVWQGGNRHEFTSRGVRRNARSRTRFRTAGVSCGRTDLTIVEGQSFTAAAAHGIILVAILAAALIPSLLPVPGWLRRNWIGNRFAAVDEVCGAGRLESAPSMLEQDRRLTSGFGSFIVFSGISYSVLSYCNYYIIVSNTRLPRCIVA